MTPDAPLVIGYGSSLRGDDAIGQEVADALWLIKDQAPELTGAEFLWAQQLAPEMALDVSRAGFTVFMDAARDGRPAGSVTTRTLAPVEEGRSSVPSYAQAGCWQDLSPEATLALAVDLYGRAPPAVLVTVSVDNEDLGAGLSPPVRAAVPWAVAAVRLALVRAEAGQVRHA